jgi:eukaryotic-like serine/threonine-protein kinase
MDDSNFHLPQAQWTLLRRLLDQALELPPAARSAWLAALPAEHATLRARLRALLSHADAATGHAPLLQTLPKVETGDFAPWHPQAERSGELVGPYRLLRQLGEGGMASVWLAERVDWPEQRRVALKLPHGAWRRGGLVERFARERAILGSLEHAHIARLYDAGVTPAGQPYLALEYVDGERIDHWCDSHAQGVPERVALFLQVCEAVAHAHARLIVHRDIKPSNVLVDASGQVRLLDFGIAKLLEGDSAAETALTRESGRALTPEYAAPEQIQGEPVGTATDTYSMGVLLYELLAGRHPYASEQTTLAARTQAALAADPARPSDAAADPARRRALRGDLDTIVLKALKKRPVERYASADALAADLRRYLRHEPVLARPDSKAYRVRKLLRRHRVAVGAGAAVAFALLVGATLAAWQAHEARLQRDAALRAQALAEHAERVAVAESELSGFLLAEMSAGSDALAAQLERARRMFDAQYRNDPALRGRLLVHLGGLFNGRGDVARAQALWAEAEPLLRGHGEWSALAELQCFRARDLARDGHIEKARATIAEAVQALTRADAAAAGPARRDCLASEGVVERVAGNTARAVVLLEQAVAAEQQAGRAEQGTFVELLNVLARAYFDAARYRDAVLTARRASALVAQLGLEHTSHESTARGLQALALRDGGRPLDALALQTPSPGTTPRLSERIQSATTLLQLGRLDGFAATLDELLAASRALGPSYQRDVRLLQVRALTDLGRLREAAAALADAEALFAPQRADKRYTVRRLLLVRAHWSLASGDLAGAQGAIDEASAVVAATGQRDDPAWHTIHQLQARVHLANSRATDALKAADDALDWSQRLAVDPSGSLHVADDRLLRAQALRMLGNFQGARADAVLAERHARAGGGDEHPLVRLAKAELLR